MKLASAMAHILAGEPPADRPRVLRVLEVGWCGPDVRDAFVVLREGSPLEYWASAPSALRVARMRREHPEIVWTLLDPANALAGAGPVHGTFDIVFAAGVPSDEPARARWLGNLHPLLRPHGVVIVHDATRPLALLHAHALVAQASDAAESLAGEPFPLTDIQHAYWLGRNDVFALGGVSCHVYFEWRLPQLDLPRFEAAWNRLVARHGMLRAHMTPDGKQRVLPRVDAYRIPIDDLRSLPEPEATTRWMQTRTRMCDQVLDAGRWPLFDLRASLEPNGRTRLHLDLDLLLFDVQSFHVALAELGQFYQGSGDSLPAIGLTFRDYVLAEAREKSSAAYEADRAWWLRQLDTVAPPPDLPLARAPGGIARPTFRRLGGALSPDAWRRLSELASGAKVTASALLLAAFSEVLARYAQDGRFSLNLTHFNRRRVHPDVDRLVGDFTSVLLVSVDCREPKPLVERSCDVQAQLWERLSHLRFGGVEVMRELARRSGETNGTPMPVVFTSLLGMDLDPLVRGGDLLAEPEFLYTCTPQVWLDHQVMVRNGNLEFNWIVIEELFPEGLVDAMFASYTSLLHDLVAEPERFHRPAGALLPASQVAVRARANDTARPLPLEPIHSGFFRHMIESPDALACVTTSEELTYAELGGQALAIARTLRAAGLGEGDAVVLSAPKGTEQVAAALGILAAGCVLVPVPPDCPEARVHQIVEQSSARALWAARPAARDLGIPNLRVPRASVPPAPRNAAELETLVAAPSLDDVAYVIFTSGSTGVPKGVVITHGAASNTLLDVNDRTALTRADRVFGISALSFDLAIYDLFATFQVGGTLVLPDDDALREPRHWLDAMHRHGVTLWNSVPALMQMLVSYAEATGVSLPTSLRWVLLSGDWVPVDMERRLRALAPQASLRIAAMGGATEASIWSNWFEMRDVPPHARSIPYGFPLANQRYRVLDAALRDRPDHVAGDLYIAGYGLALGYIGDAERTAKSFIHDPANDERLYRTGDRARYAPDGCLEFLGRVDDQVKVGGYRIELGDIESALLTLPEVRAAAAHVCETPRGTKQLAVYVVPAAGPARSETWNDLRDVADRAAKETPPEATIDALCRFQETTELLAPELMMRNLHALGFDLHAGASWTLDAASEACGVLPSFRRVLRSWLTVLEAEGHVVTHEGRTVIRTAFSCQELDARIARRASEVRQHLAWLEDGEAFFAWVLSSAAALPDVLRGRAEPVTLLFPAGESRNPELLYRRNALADHLGAIAASALTAIAIRDGARGVRVLEVGAGVGGLTSSTLPALAAVAPDAEYHYTDVSDYFAELGQSRFGRHRGLRVGRFDVNQSAGSQGLAPESFDVILAGNVLHNAHDVGKTLRELHGLLRPSGALVFLEATRDKRLQWVTAAAVLEQAAKGGAREDESSPFYDEDTWCKAARDAGFVHAEAFPGDGSPLAFAGQRVFIAERSPSVSLTLEHVKQQLSSRLPAYMIPEHVVCLERLPLTSNGKVDRQKLPVPATLRPNADTVDAGDENEAPRDGMEAQLALAWGNVLRAGPITRGSNFFALGGDSLLATRLTAQLTATLQRNVAVRLVFQHPRLLDQARALEAEPAPAAAWSPIVRLGAGAGAKGGTLVCIHASDGFAMPYRALAERLSGSIACVALQAFGLEAGQACLESVQAMAAEYIRALRVAGERGPWHLLGWSMGAYIAAEMAVQLAHAGETVSLVALLDPAPQEPFAALGADARLTGWRTSIESHPVAASVDPAARERMLSVLSHNVAAMIAHDLQPIPAQRAIVYEAAAHPQSWGDPLASWRPFLPARTQVVLSDRSHWDVLSDPSLAENLERLLA